MAYFFQFWIPFNSFLQVLVRYISIVRNVSHFPYYELYTSTYIYIYVYGGWSKFLVPQITIFADKNVTLANLSRDQSKTLADHNVRHFGGIFLSYA